MFGDWGDMWIQANVNLPANPTITSYRVLIDGQVGQGYYGDLAIDDIQVTLGLCP